VVRRVDAAVHLAGTRPHGSSNKGPINWCPPSNSLRAGAVGVRGSVTASWNSAFAKSQVARLRSGGFRENSDKTSADAKQCPIVRRRIGI
jgi:hypothetical protein